MLENQLRECTEKATNDSVQQQQQQQQPNRDHIQNQFITKHNRIMDKYKLYYNNDKDTPDNLPDYSNKPNNTVDTVDIIGAALKVEF